MDKMCEMNNTVCDCLAEHLLEVFRKRGYTFASAESCTGGLTSARLTAIAGSSDVVEGGVVSYSNDVKMKVLSVSAETLAAYGAVSEETAREMAEGVRRITGADIAVSITGIAGPSGGSAEKPVGTVCFGVATLAGVTCETVHFESTLSRGEIRRLASDHALTLSVAAAEKEVKNA